MVNWEHLNVKPDYMVRRQTWIGWDIIPRRLNCFELMYAVKGECDVWWGDEYVLVKGGDMVLFRPGELHRLSVTREPCIDIYCVHFHIPEGMDLPLPRVAQISHGHRIESVFKEMLDVYQGRDALYQWRQNMLTEQLIWEVCMEVYQKNAPMEERRVRKVLDYIHKDPYGHYTLDELAEKSGVKKTAFLQAFRSMTGTTPKQYIIDLRLENARELLLTTSMPISEIAEHCGFTDAFYFSRCFRNRFSKGPREYRKARYE